MKKLTFLIPILLSLISQSQSVIVTADGRLQAVCPTCPPPIIKHDTIYIIQEANKPPTANAGNDISFQLPANLVVLNGSGTDADGIIAGYSWSRISGPASFSFSNQFTASTTVNNLVAGTYIFRLTVTDNKGARAFDDISITVTPASTSPSTTIPLSFIQRTDDYPRQDAGVDKWHNGFPVPVWGTAKPLNKYYRFNMSELTNADGSFNWTEFDKQANGAFADGQRFSFGVMTACPGCDVNRMASYAGGTAAYPLALHNAMQAESVKDWRMSNGHWIPNWNSPAYLKYLFDFNKALNDHIISIGWRNRIFNVDVRGYGAWGEWHSGGGIVQNDLSEYPAGTRPTLASLKTIVDAHTKTFTDFPLVAMIAAYDRGYLGIINNPIEIAVYMLTQRNNWGLIGWRRDQWGATDSYLAAYLENNVTTFGIRDSIMNRWKHAPIVGEPPSWNVDNFFSLIAQVKLYKGSQFGNGNYGSGTSISAITANVKEAAFWAGHRLTLKGGSVTTGATTTITLIWENLNRPPTYMNWEVLYQVDGVTVGKSSFNPRFFTGTKPATDSFSGIPKGKLTVKVVDPTGFAKPYTLGITGQNVDFSYPLTTIN